MRTTILAVYAAATFTFAGLMLAIALDVAGTWAVPLALAFGPCSVVAGVSLAVADARVRRLERGQ
jgi:hypothetical protein